MSRYLGEITKSVSEWGRFGGAMFGAIRTLRRFGALHVTTSETLT